MKKGFIAISIILTIAILFCINSYTKNMIITPTKLDNKEKNILEFLGLKENTYIYDYKVNNNIKYLSLILYRLENKKWTELAKTGRELTETNGKLMIKNFKLNSDTEVRFQTKSATDGCIFTCEKNAKNNNKELVTAWGGISEATPINKGQLIPLAMISSTKKDNLNFSLNYFYTPEKLIDCEDALAIAIRFTESPDSNISFNGKMIGNMQLAAKTYAEKLLTKYFDKEPFTIIETSTAMHATFNGTFLVSFDMKMANTKKLIKYAYKIKVDECMNCTLLDEGENLTAEDL